MSINIIDWGMKIMNDSLAMAGNENIKHRITYKMKHSSDVVLAGQEIMAREKTIKWGLETGMITCFLHDIGQFLQIINKNNNKYLKMDHGKLGARMIKEQNFKNIDMKKIIEAIIWHSKKTYKGKNIYCKLVRDADKTAKFRHYNEMEEYHAKNKVIDIDWHWYYYQWFWDVNFEATKKIWRSEEYLNLIINKFEKLGMDSDKLQLVKNKLSNF